MHPLEINDQKIEQWFDELKKYSKDFLTQLPKSWAYKEPVHLGLPTENPFIKANEFSQLLKEYEQFMQAGGVHTASGRFMGYIPGGGLPIAAFADFLAALTNRFSGMFYTSPGAQKIEADVIWWMCRLLNFPQSSWGTLTSGGATANLLAILCAREKLNFEQWPQGVIYLTSECHMTIERALKIAGLSAVPTRKIPVDKNFRMNIEELEAQIIEDTRRGFVPWMMIANAGSTNLGAIDPLEKLGHLAQRLNMWFHVDAAYGGFFQLTERGRQRLQGIELADSVTLDPHKGLFQPYGCGALIVREGKKLQQAIAHSASYLQETEVSGEISQTDYSLELTRHFRALRVWMSLKIFGEKAFAETLDEKLNLTQKLCQALKDIPGIQLVLERPDLTVVGFRAQTEPLTQKLHAEILRRGQVFLSSSRVRYQKILRICILSFRTHWEEVELCLNEIRTALAAISI